MADRLIVQKYGGSSLSTPARIRQIAEKIARQAGDHTGIIVIVSAMGRTTDDLVKLAFEVSPSPEQRELDMLLTVGERISMALLSMALNSMGCQAISFTGSQSGIVTNISHNQALIEEIRADRIRAELALGKVVIVAGFQGVSRRREITTLGRGGSDTTAVALAAALDADVCEIFSDVAGVYTADPRLVKSARQIPTMVYDEMLELAALGAKVLHFRAAEIARRYRVPLHLLSSFEEKGGTLVRPDSPIEQAKATSITSNRDVSLARITGPAADTVFIDVLRAIGEHEVQLVACHKDTVGSEASLSLIVDGRDAGKLDQILGALPHGPSTCETRDDVATVSIVGTGFAGTAEPIRRLEAALAASSIATTAVITSSLSVTCIVPQSLCERAVEVLHTTFFEESSD